jgi:hypothetical protein
MSRLEVPLVFRTLRTSGDDVLRAELVLRIKTDLGSWELIPSLVDSGTEMTTMPAGVAMNRRLPIPRRPVSGLAFQGQEVRPGLLRARIPGMDATEYVFPCYSLGDPDVVPSNSRNLLGLTGVIDQIRLIFDGTPSLVAPRGLLIVEKK